MLHVYVLAFPRERFRRLNQMNGLCAAPGADAQRRCGVLLAKLPSSAFSGVRLIAAGVSMWAAMAIMRHGDPQLTMRVYTDERQIDVAAEVAKLLDVGSGLCQLLALRFNEVDLRKRWRQRQSGGPHQKAVKHNSARKVATWLDHNLPIRTRRSSVACYM